MLIGQLICLPHLHLDICYNLIIHNLFYSNKLTGSNNKGVRCVESKSASDMPHIFSAIGLRQSLIKSRVSCRMGTFLGWGLRQEWIKGHLQRNLIDI